MQEAAASQASAQQLMMAWRLACSAVDGETHVSRLATQLLVWWNSGGNRSVQEHPSPASAVNFAHAASGVSSAIAGGGDRGAGAGVGSAPSLPAAVGVVFPSSIDDGIVGCEPPSPRWHDSRSPRTASLRIIRRAYAMTGLQSLRRPRGPGAATTGVAT